VNTPQKPLTRRRVGIWLIGACGGIGGTVALGLEALRRGLIGSTSMTTELPAFQHLDLDNFGSIVIGGHDIRRSSFRQAVRELHERAGVFDAQLIDPCLPALDEWTANIRPGTAFNAGAAIQKLADLPEAQRAENGLSAIERIQADLQAFRTDNQLDQVVVVNIASTEPPAQLSDIHASMPKLRAALESRQLVLPASGLYAWAALDLGWPYINFTPSLGASFPAASQLAGERKAVFGGKDGKTGETLLKTVLAPMFAHRNLKLLSWVGHNIFGNRDGQVLDDPANKASKIQTKDQVISQIVGYKPQTHVSIEYIESLDDWKTAWDHIHFQGFLGVRMSLQFTWQGCDSILAAPLVLDLARLALMSQRRGEVGVLKHLACFFKSPMGVTEQDFFKQFEMLAAYATTPA
jgi:myo-inositol-1-phosphate synthase